MATTTKTLAPTNQTITIPDMTERPNASVLTDGISKEADAINALNSKVTNLERDPVVIGEYNGTTATSIDLAINANDFRLLAFLIYDSDSQIVNSVVAPPLGFRNVTAKIYGESSSQWGSILLASDYASATFNRTTATTTKVRLYGIY